MVYRIYSYLKFLLSATNQHGVHSPFVYDYVTNCIYKKDTYSLSKTHKIVVKSIRFFKHTSIIILGNSKTIKNDIHRYCKNISFTEKSSKLVYADLSSNEFDDFNLEKMSNDGMLIISNIYKSKETTQNWQSLKNRKVVRVTVDLFCCGIIFFRKEQAKEHFKIRI